MKVGLHHRQACSSRENVMKGIFLLSVESLCRQIMFGITTINSAHFIELKVNLYQRSDTRMQQIPYLDYMS